MSYYFTDYFQRTIVLPSHARMVARARVLLQGPSAHVQPTTKERSAKHVSKTNCLVSSK